jgi:hypothetical protein
VAPLPLQFTACDGRLVTGSHAAADVAREDLAAATSVLLLGQDFLEQVRKFYCSATLSFC